MPAAQAAKEEMTPVFSLAAPAASIRARYHCTRPIPHTDTWLRFSEIDSTPNSRPGHAPPAAALYQGIGPANSNTTTGFQAFQYDFCGGPRCNAKERDAESGLDFFGARYFSGAQGRFTSVDEFKGGIVDVFTGQDVETNSSLPYADITDPQTLNKYVYVRNNPLRYTDPDGHCPWCIGAVVGAFGGAGAQAVADLATGQQITFRKEIAAAVGGAIIGGTAGAASELGVAVQLAIVGDAGVVGGVAERTINTGSLDKATENPTEMVQDLLSQVPDMV